MTNVLIGIFFLSHSNWVSFTAFEQKNRRDETALFLCCRQLPHFVINGHLLAGTTFLNRW
jgi:hypothetical protein